MTAKSAKRRLALSTVLASGLLCAAAPAWAQASMPDTGHVTNVNTGLGGAVPTTPVFTPTPTPTGTNLQVDLRNNRTILTWGGTGFNIAAGNSVDFKDARATAGVTNRVDNIAVLNRDLSGNTSTIRGAIRSDPNVAVYLVNRAGVYFGPTATVDTGALFASGSDITNDNDFLNGASTLRFGLNDGAAVNVDGATINTAATSSTNGGRMGDVVLLGTYVGVTGNSTVSAVNGDVGLIAAKDVTVQNAPGSPLSFTINSGSTVNYATILNVDGNVTGRNVTLAALHNPDYDTGSTNHMVVSGTVTATGASSTDRGVVLTAAVGSEGVAIAPGATGHGNYLITGSVISAKNIYINTKAPSLVNGVLNASGLIDISSSYFAGSEVQSASSLTAGSIAIHGGGGFGGLIKTTAGNLTFDTGDYVFGGSLTVAGDFTGTATRFTASNVDVAGNISVTTGQSQYWHGTAKAQGAISLTSTDLDESYAYLGRGADITVYGTLTSTAGNIKIKTRGTADLRGILAAGGVLDVQGDYGIWLTNGTGTHGVKLVTGASTADNKGVLTLGSYSAPGADADLTIQALKIQKTTEIGQTATRLDLQAGRDISVTVSSLNNPQLLLGTVTAGRNVSISSYSVDAVHIEGTAGSVTVNTTAFPQVSPTGFLNVQTIVAGTDITLSGMQILVDNLTATLGNILVTGTTGTARLGGSTGTGSVAAGGSIDVTAGSAVQLRGNVTAGGDIAVKGTGVILGSTAAPGIIKGKGAITLEATTTGVSVSGTTTVQSNSDGVGNEPITILSATVASASATSLLMGGTNRQSDIQIRSGANSVVSLGAISARSLLGATGSDPFTNGLNRNAAITLNGSVSLVNSLRLQGTSVTTNAITVSNGTIDVRASAPLTIAGAVEASGDVSFRTSAGDLTIGAAGHITGQNVVLSTPAAFKNLAGANAITVNGYLNHWKIYSANPAGNIFGGLDSGFSALWNATIATLPPEDVTVNRYIFALAPTLTFAPANVTKIYGEDFTGQFGPATQRGLYTVTGYQPGVAGAFRGDTAETAYQNMPTFISDGLGMYAKVLGGPYALTLASNLGLVSSSGYNIVIDNSGNAKITVSPRPLTITYVANNKQYDGTLTGSGRVDISGLIGQDYAYGSGATWTFDNKNAGAGRTVTVGGVVISPMGVGTDLSNYTWTLPGNTVTADIFKREVRLAIYGNNKVYDGTTDAPGAITRIEGVVAGEDVNIVGGTVVFRSKNASNGAQLTLVGALSLAGADIANYQIGAFVPNFSIIFQKQMTGTISVNNKVYDGTRTGSGAVTLTGVIAGDAVGTAGATFTFDNKNAGTAKTVTLSGLTLTGADANNYSLALFPTTATADILKKALTGTVTANSKTYDGTNGATGSVLLTGVVSGDTVGTTGSVFTFADKNAGTGKAVSVTGTTLSGADAANYSFTISGNAIADIFKKALTGTVTANSKTYDGTTAGSGTIALSGVISGDAVGTAGSVFAFADKSAGAAKTVTVSGTTLNGADAGNYTLSLSATAVADILKKALTGTITANSKTYDGTIGATGSVSLTGVVSGDTVGTTGSVFTFADKNAGTGKTVSVTGTTLTGADAANYSFTLSGNAIADIFKKALTGTVTVNNKTYDGTTGATGSVSLSGVIAGDDLSTSNFVLSFADKNAGTGKTVTVAGTLSGADAGNYTLGGLTGFADILKKALTGTITANSKTYDGTTGATGAVTLNGIVSGDSVGTTGSVFAFADKNAGNGKTVNVSGTSLNGADAGNYTLSLSATAIADIFKKALTGTVTVNSKTYDGTTAATGSVLLGGVVSGDTVGTTGSVFAFADKNAGAGKAVSVTGTALSGADAANYSFTLSGNAVADIFKKALTGTVTVNNKTYDGTTGATGSVSLSGVIAGDDLSTSNFVLSFADKNVGTGKTVTVAGTLSGAGAGNYTLGGLTGFADILKKALTGTVTANDKTYDGTRTASGSVSLSGVVGGDSVGTSGSVFTFADKNAGTGKTVTVTGTTLSGADAGNYTLALSGTALATIFKKAITGIGTVTGKTYDGTTAATGGAVTLSGVIAGDDVGTAGSAFAFADKNAGTGKTVNVSGTTLTGTDAANYTLGSVAAIGDIFRLAINGTATVNNKTYDGTTTGSGTISLTGMIVGDSVGTTGSVFTFASKNAGTGKTVTVTGTTLNGADSGNYTLTLPASALADILRKAITGSISVNSRQYDGTTAGTGTVTLNGLVSGDAVGTTGTVFTFSDKNAGANKTVTVSGTALNGADAGNYTLTPLPGTALGEILKRIVAVAADNKSKNSNDTDPLLTFTITSGSLVSGDAFSGLLARAAGETPGNYAISIGSLSAGGNYQLNFTPGVFTIEIDPATQVQQTLKAIPLPSQIQGQQSSDSDVTIDKEALCGEDTACKVQ